MEPEQTVCEKGHRVYSRSCVVLLSHPALKIHWCNYCYHNIYLCVPCGNKAKYMIDYYDHLVNHHSGSRSIKINLDDRTVTLNLSLYTGLQYSLYLKSNVLYGGAAPIEYYDTYQLMYLIYMVDYSCIFCGDAFDCLPPYEILSAHIKKCV